MKTILTVLFLLFYSIAFSQYFVNFEGSGETRNTYDPGTVSLTGLNWDFIEALISTSENDFKNGDRSARIRGRNGSGITMSQDKPNGLGNISFQYRRFGTDGNQQPWVIEYSTNQGSDWTQIGSPITATEEVQTFSEVVNISGNIRIRIRINSTPGISGDRRMNVDDIVITDFGNFPKVLFQEIYGGGGNTNAKWNRDVVQLRNAEDTAVDLSGWTIQYAPSTSAFSANNIATLPNGTMIQPGQLLNVMLAQGDNGDPVPDPKVDAGAVNLAVLSGKIALMSSGIKIYGNTCPDITVVDFVGYGSGSNCGPHSTSNVSGNVASYERQHNNNTVPGVYNVKEIALPITMGEFTVKPKDKSHWIEWNTLNETNNDYMLVEHSDDGRNYTEIHRTQGAGTTYEKQYYSFLYEHPVPGINYYRIKQVDYDGRYSYSEVRSMRHDFEEGIVIYPSYTQGMLNIKTDMEKYSLQVFNTAGKEMKIWSGLSQNQTIDFNELRAGIYIVRVTKGSFVHTQRIIKL
ncbi:MAG TPA: lamin tail domain-containing protein [Saprospiraceae bacterium]|nr:lamin tail domain-containing protein [Saprospiraceae bacterium]